MRTSRPARRAGVLTLAGLPVVASALLWPVVGLGLDARPDRGVDPLPDLPGEEQLEAW